MKRHLYLSAITASVLGLFASSHAANALTVQLQGFNFVAAPGFFTAPVTTAGPGVVSLHEVGSVAGITRSPWEGTATPNNEYTVLSRGGTGASSATYNCTTASCTTLNFMWGSPDDYNFVDFYAGAGGTGALLGTIVGIPGVVPPGPPGSGCTGAPCFINVTLGLQGGAAFGSAVFRDTGQAAFEYTNVAVPGPIVGAGLPGLIAACGGLLALARRRRHQNA
jgi:hypothetical protein